MGPTTNATSGAQLVGTATYRGVAEVNRFARQWALEHAGEFALVPRIVGLCMVMRRALVDEIGGFDTAFGFGNCEDDDLCVRILRAGHQIAIAYDVFIHHHGSATFRSLDLDARALVDENWRIFCHKWRHPPQRHGPDALAALARAAPFDPATDRVPVDYREIFNPARDAAAAGDGQAGARALHPRLPRRARRPRRWSPSRRRRVRVVVRRPGARRSRASSRPSPRAIRSSLLVRVEPPTPEGAAQAAEVVRALLRELGLPEERAADVLVDATPLPPARRGSLYTCAAAFLSCGGARDQFYRREAQACGLTLAELERRALRRGAVFAHADADADARDRAALAAARGLGDRPHRRSPAAAGARVAQHPRADVPGLRDRRRQRRRAVRGATSSRGSAARMRCATRSATSRTRSAAGTAARATPACARRAGATSPTSTMTTRSTPITWRR